MSLLSLGFIVPILRCAVFWKFFKEFQRIFENVLFTNSTNYSWIDVFEVIPKFEKLHGHGFVATELQIW